MLFAANNKTYYIHPGYSQIVDKLAKGTPFMVKYYYDGGVFMYKKKNRAKQHQMQFITLDDLVPADHILRLIDDAIDFSFIYDEVEGLYASGRDGRPGIDPVSLF